MGKIVKKLRSSIITIIIIGVICSSVIVSKRYLDSTLVHNYDEYYEAVRTGIANYESVIKVKVKNYSNNIEDIDIVNEVLENNPEYIGNFKSYKSNYVEKSYYKEFTIEFNYLISKEVLLDRENQVNEKVKEIISNIITPEMSDVEKELAIHDFVINNCKYDERYFTDNLPIESYSAYGTLILGNSVCQGYAVAMDKLLNAVGIESKIVVGEALNADDNTYISHAWNIVKLDNEFYHVDATWDDPIMEDGSERLRYSYFNLTDSQIEINHKWNKDNYQSCTGTKYWFDNLEIAEKDQYGNEVIIVNDYEDFYNKFKENFSNNINNRTYKIKNFDGVEDNVNNYIKRAYINLGRYGSYSYTVEIDEISKAGYINITF